MREPGRAREIDATRTAAACAGAPGRKRSRMPSETRAPSTGSPRDAGARPPTGRAHRERSVTPYIVVVAMDLSEPGGRAWRFAFDLAALRGEAEIHAVVVGPRGMAPAVRDVATPGASSATALPPPPLRVLQHRSPDGQARLMAMHFRVGRPDRAIVGLANELGADLIVVATHPTSRLQRLLGGSTADRVARNAPCPVVVVRPKRDEDEELEDAGFALTAAPPPEPERGEDRAAER